MTVTDVTLSRPKLRLTPRQFATLTMRCKMFGQELPNDWQCPPDCPVAAACFEALYCREAQTEAA